MDQGQSSGLMGFWQHLDELKVRLMRCLWGFLGGFMICYFFTNTYVFEFLQKPLFAALPPDQRKLYFTSLFENFLTHLKIAGYSSLFLLCPFYFFPGSASQRAKACASVYFGREFLFHRRRSFRLLRFVSGRIQIFRFLRSSKRHAFAHDR